ncbi:hypothetical protein NM208_g5804 [Fusarium decemcellulare]|uniref:Uncharacterized protein n=1 Tax=Fusarium decemcellulare TaxID=57161 RepID=A0ACC1SFN1_9HYPO|nr:hypothetical protein NM208_g5804 [Fusarium decemcellulare]
MAPLSSPHDLGLAKIFARALASSTTSSPPTLVERQEVATVTVIRDDGDGGSGTYLSGGAIAGIVIGSIVGTLLLLWIIRSCFNLGAPPHSDKGRGSLGIIIRRSPDIATVPEADVLAFRFRPLLLSETRHRAVDTVVRRLVTITAIPTVVVLAVHDTTSKPILCLS